MSTFAVMGATGRTGSKIAKALISAGHQVRVLGRSQERLAGLQALGAKPLVGDSADRAYLARAFAGADGVYTLMPFDPQQAGYFQRQRAQGEAIAAALKQAGTPYVVALSSLGAEQASGTGVIESLYEQEQRLQALPGSHVMLLRPGAFFESVFSLLPGVRYEGVLADAVAPDMPVPMIATADVASAAAAALQARDWQGLVVRELLGPEDLTNRQVAAIVGQAIGQPALEYHQVPYEDMAGVLASAGLAPDLAQLLVAFAQGINEGRIRSLEGRNARNSTPTPLAAMSPDFQVAYAALEA